MMKTCFLSASRLGPAGCRYTPLRRSDLRRARQKRISAVHCARLLLIAIPGIGVSRGLFLRLHGYGKG
jgi:hypothetical protein